MGTTIWDEGALDVRSAAKFIGCGRSRLFELMDEGKVAWASLDGKPGAKRVCAVASLKRFLISSAAAHGTAA